MTEIQEAEREKKNQKNAGRMEENSELQNKSTGNLGQNKGTKEPSNPKCRHQETLSTPARVTTQKAPESHVSMTVNRLI